MSAKFAPQVQEIVAEVLGLERVRARRLAAVTLGVPTAMPSESVAEAVREALAASGASAVEVRTRPSSGGLRVVSIELAR